MTQEPRGNEPEQRWVVELRGTLAVEVFAKSEEQARQLALTTMNEVAGRFMASGHIVRPQMETGSVRLAEY